jgi:hypothetical protein
VATAPGPLRLATRPDARGARYSPEFAVEVAVSKYADHLPLERQARIMRREGLMIDSQTLWDQLATVADVLRPTYDALGQYVLQSPIVGADETWWRLMERPAAKRWWVWSVTREDAVVYRILDTRSQHAAREVLTGAIDSPGAPAARLALRSTLRRTADASELQARGSAMSLWRSDTVSTRRDASGCRRDMTARTRSG